MILFGLDFFRLWYFTLLAKNLFMRRFLAVATSRVFKVRASNLRCFREYYSKAARDSKFCRLIETERGLNDVESYIKYL